MAVHPIVVDIFQSGPSPGQWTNGAIDRVIRLVKKMHKKYLDNVKFESKMAFCVFFFHREVADVSSIF